MTDQVSEADFEGLEEFAQNLKTEAANFRSAIKGLHDIPEYIKTQGSLHTKDGRVSPVLVPLCDSTKKAIDVISSKLDAVAGVLEADASSITRYVNAREEIEATIAKKAETETGLGNIKL